MQKHVVLMAIGLLLGVAVVAWVRPGTNAGTTLLVLLVLLVVYAIGMLALRLIGTPKT